MVIRLVRSLECGQRVKEQFKYFIAVYVKYMFLNKFQESLVVSNKTHYIEERYITIKTDCFYILCWLLCGK